MEKKNKPYKKFLTSNVIITLLIIALAFSLLFPLWSFYTYRISARSALREAKNVQLAIRLVSTEYYGNGQTFRSVDTASGLTDNACEEVLQMAEADGSLSIHQWNVKERMPSSFDYQKGKYLVAYRQDEEGENEWTVSRIHRILTYSQ